MVRDGKGSARQRARAAMRVVCRVVKPERDVLGTKNGKQWQSRG